MPAKAGHQYEKMKAAAKARGQTGFLKPRIWHTVSVSTIGTVYEGYNARDARQAIHRWTKLSQDPNGRAYNQPIVHTTNAE